ncbi:sensor histidine kinase [Burkholderia pseudomallei]|nr:sensor histidine kinase [Burkholderia pseudomallei]
MSPDPAVTSLRRTLLRRLAAPLSMLALMSGLIAYWLAWQYTQHVVDRSLADLASAISKQIQIAGPDAPFTVPPLAQAMFSDPTEQLIYRISDGEHELAGDPKLPLQGTSVRRMHVAYVFEAEYDNQAVRVAQVRVAQTESGNPMIVEVAQPVRYRYRIAAEFLIAIMMPLLLLLLAGWGIVWRVVNQQLGPLTHLADSLNRQTHTSLEPVDETEVPLEIRPLTSAMNALLGRLKTALDAQRKFIADAAHQLRTPLTAIKLHAEQAAVARDPQQALTAVRELRSAADRAVRLSNQLLSLARAEPGEQAARFVDVDLAALAFETGAEWVPRALAAHVDLGFQRGDGRGDDEPLVVRGNPVLLREVIANLLDNALKYVPLARPQGARITMDVSRIALDEGHAAAEIVVEDNGSGVPAAQQADLFKRFFRGDAQSGNGVETGAGLGLAIVHDIIAMHGGSDGRLARRRAPRPRAIRDRSRAHETTNEAERNKTRGNGTGGNNAGTAFFDSNADSNAGKPRRPRELAAHRRRASLLLFLVLAAFLRLLLFLAFVFFRRCKQRAAARRRAAMARVFALELFRQARVDHETVVVEQFFLLVDVTQRMDVHAPAHFLGFAVRRARMVDPARAVAVDLAVDHPALFQREVKGVIRIVRVVRMAAQRLFPRDPLALVFDYALSRLDRYRGEYALAVNARAAYHDPA